MFLHCCCVVLLVASCFAVGVQVQERERDCLFVEVLRSDLAHEEAREATWQVEVQSLFDQHESAISYKPTCAGPRASLQVGKRQPCSSSTTTSSWSTASLSRAHSLVHSSAAAVHCRFRRLLHTHRPERDGRRTSDEKPARDTYAAHRASDQSTAVDTPTRTDDDAHARDPPHNGTDTRTYTCKSAL